MNNLISTSPSMYMPDPTQPQAFPIESSDPLHLNKKSVAIATELKHTVDVKSRLNDEIKPLKERVSKLNDNLKNVTFWIFGLFALFIPQIIFVIERAIIQGRLKNLDTKILEAGNKIEVLKKKLVRAGAVVKALEAEKQANIKAEEKKGLVTKGPSTFVFPQSPTPIVSEPRAKKEHLELVVIGTKMPIHTITQPSLNLTLKVRDPSSAQQKELEDFPALPEDNEYDIRLNNARQAAQEAYEALGMFIEQERIDSATKIQVLVRGFLVANKEKAKAIAFKKLKDNVFLAKGLKGLKGLEKFVDLEALRRGFNAFINNNQRENNSNSEESDSDSEVDDDYETRYNSDGDETMSVGRPQSDNEESDFESEVDDDYEPRYNSDGDETMSVGRPQHDGEESDFDSDDENMFVSISGSESEESESEESDSSDNDEPPNMVWPPLNGSRLGTGNEDIGNRQVLANSNNANVIANSDQEAFRKDERPGLLGRVGGAAVAAVKSAIGKVATVKTLETLGMFGANRLIGAVRLMDPTDLIRDGKGKELAIGMGLAAAQLAIAVQDASNRAKEEVRLKIEQKYKSEEKKLLLKMSEDIENYDTYTQEGLLLEEKRNRDLQALENSSAAVQEGGGAGN